MGFRLHFDLRLWNLVSILLEGCWGSFCTFTGPIDGTENQ